MSKDVFAQEIRSTGDFPSDGVVARHDDGVFQFVNSLDQSADWSIEGTYEGDTNFSDAVQLNTGTASSGDTMKQALSEPWDKVRVVVTTTTAPTSGSFVAKYHVDN